MLKTSITEFSERNLEYLVYVWYDTCISGILHNCNKNVLEFILDFKKKSGNIGPPKFSKMLTKTNVIISESFDYFRNINIVIGYQKITSVETENDI